MKNKQQPIVEEKELQHQETASKQASKKEIEELKQTIKEVAQIAIQTHHALLDLRNYTDYAVDLVESASKFSEQHTINAVLLLAKAELLPPEEFEVEKQNRSEQHTEAGKVLLKKMEQAKIFRKTATDSIWEITQTASKLETKVEKW